MTTRRRSRVPWGRAFATLLTAGACAYFGYHAKTGPNGWDAREMRIAERAELRTELASLTRTRERMGRRAALLDGTQIERDVLDERARELLGYARPDEIVLILE